MGRTPIPPLSLMAAVAGMLPKNAVVVDESVSSGAGLRQLLQSDDAQSFFGLRGGGIGWGLPAAIGVKLALPERPAVALIGDGSAMYTIQSLWTQARENLDIVTIVFANHIYQILRGEFDNVGAGEPGQRANDMLRLDRPTLDFVAMAKGMGVPGRAVTNADEFNKALAEAVAEPGPRLIEVQM